MAVTKEQKTLILKKFQTEDLDTGSCEVQIALLTARINDMSGHFSKHKKDHQGRRGLVKAVNQRRKLLNYLIKNDVKRYETIIEALNLRG